MAFVLHEMDGLLLVKMKPASVQLPCSGEDLPEYQTTRYLPAPMGALFASNCR